jgi:hypothetical protein
MQHLHKRQSTFIKTPKPKPATLNLHLVPHHHDVLALALHLNDDRLQALNDVQVGLARGVPATENTFNVISDSESVQQMW